VKTTTSAPEDSDERGYSERIEAEASHWAGRSEGVLSPRDREQLRAWLALDVRHQAAFQTYRRLARRMEKLRAHGPAAEPAACSPEFKRNGSSLIGRRLGLAIGVAAVLAFVAFWMRPPSGDAGPSGRTVAEAGGLRTVSLPDGSTVRLNHDSEMTVAFSDRMRSVVLANGEAHFEVTPDAKRPFVVSAGGVSVRAVGTAFLVRHAEAEVEVLVTAGVVDVNYAVSGAPETKDLDVRLLEAGQRTVIRSPFGTPGDLSTGTVETWTRAEIDRRLAWTQPLLDFPPTPLREIVAEMNRHSAHRLRLADPALGNMSVGGSFRLGDRETFILMLEASFGLRAERGAEETVLHGRSESGPGPAVYSPVSDK
jgi:transmembrane sensor